MSNNLLNTGNYFGLNTTISINTGINHSVSTATKNQSTKNEAEEAQQNPTKIYGENWVVMQNKLVHAISNLALNERVLSYISHPLFVRLLI